MGTSLNATIPPHRTPPLSEWKPSARDKIEGVIAYSLLGVIVCAMFYVALRIAAEYFA